MYLHISAAMMMMMGEFSPSESLAFFKKKLKTLFLLS